MLPTRAFLAFALGVAFGCNSPTPAIRCTDSSTGRCDCSETQTVGTTTTSCSAASVGAPALCCATSNWKASSAAGCSCTTFSCVSFGSAGARTCYCGQAKGATGTTTVASCAPEAGETCCISGTGNRCTCSSQACTAGEVQVDDCTVDRIAQTCAAQFSVAYNQLLTDCR